MNRAHFGTSPGRFWLFAGPTLLAAVLALPLDARARTGSDAPRTTLGAEEACGLSDTRPLWIEFAQGSVRPEVRDVFARPGVIVASSGTALPATFRSKGAATTYFVLTLPALVGQPRTPADPASIPGVAAELLADARASTGCTTPWIALNELLGADALPPWPPSTAQYRANVLTLMQQLAAGGARPVLFVHGNPTVAGETAQWWQQVAEAGEIAYEAYYDAPRISALGPVVGNRRMRLGIRSIIRLFGSVDIPASRLGVVLGFHVAQEPGIAGRQGLQPREEWFRVVKWEALAARQVAADTGISSIWSWGWGTFGPESVDPDKPDAACVWLWARDSALCDGVAVGGAGFNPSLTEGQILIGEAYCVFPDGHVMPKAVDELTAFTRDQHFALTALFARGALGAVVPIARDELREAERRVIERAFKGGMAAYERALERRHVSRRIARGIILDELRRQAIAAMLAETGSSQTTLEWTNEVESKAAENAICRRDDLPGAGDFPRSNALDLGVVPLAQRLRFLLGDRTSPATPAAPSATSEAGAVSLGWAYGAEPDLAGYRIFRAATSGGPYTELRRTVLLPLLPRPAFVDATAPPGQPSFYVVRAVDSSGNESAPSQEVAATPS